MMIKVDNEKLLPAILKAIENGANTFNVTLSGHLVFRVNDSDISSVPLVQHAPTFGQFNMHHWTQVYNLLEYKHVQNVGLLFTPGGIEVTFTQKIDDNTVIASIPKVKDALRIAFNQYKKSLKGHFTTNQGFNIANGTVDGCWHIAGKILEAVNK